MLGLSSLGDYRRRKHRAMRRKSGLKWYKVDRKGIFGIRRQWIPAHELRDGDQIVNRDDQRPVSSEVEEGLAA